MKRLSRCCVWMAFLVAGSACRLRSGPVTADSLPGTWRLSDVSPVASSPRSGDSFEEEAKRQQAVKEGCAVTLFEDATYCELKGDGRMKTGKWHYKKEDGTLSFADAKPAPEPFPVRFETGGYGKEMMSLEITSKKIVLRFTKEAAPLTDFQNDPFYAGSNQWRIRPSKPESTEELTARFAGYLKHVALILKAAKERKQDVVSFEFQKVPCGFTTAASAFIRTI